jgi:hypothetical protein
MRDVHGDANRQFTWSKQWLKHARCRDLHEADHPRCCKDIGKSVIHLDRQCTGEVCCADYDLRRGCGI